MSALASVTDSPHRVYHPLPHTTAAWQLILIILRLFIASHL
jgi:hypothetical protein